MHKIFFTSDLLKSIAVKNNFFKKISLAGFSLIELLVAVTIVGILASVSFVGYGRIQASARDDTRVSDLATIKMALNFYYMDHDTYPIQGPKILLGENSKHSKDFSAALDPKYIKNMPQDPLIQQLDENGEEYYYRYKSVADDCFRLCATMETSESKYACVTQKVNANIIHTNDLGTLDECQ